MFDMDLESKASDHMHLHLTRCCHVLLLCFPSLRRMMCIRFTLNGIMLSVSKVQHVDLLQIVPLQKLQSIATDHLLPRLTNYPGPCDSR